MGDMRALRFIKRIESDGTIRLDELPLHPGETVEIIVRPFDDTLADLVALSESGLGFWDNDIDDQVWNDALSTA
ncbi:MAG: hypothetical protein HOP29_19930 [Phycisphaerales bacterium]|nr:hypothetical protein [Phycisphaerales bacterium]